MFSEVLQARRCSYFTAGEGDNLDSVGCSVMSNSLQPHGLYPARLLSPWGVSSRNTGVGCHFLLQGIFPTWGSNLHLLCLLHCQGGSLPLVPPGRRYCFIRKLVPFNNHLFYLVGSNVSPSRSCIQRRCSSREESLVDEYGVWAMVVVSEGRHSAI